MTLALPADVPATVPSVKGLRRGSVVLTHPGFVEKTIAVITPFILIHQTPNVWLKTRAELLETSNPLTVIVSVCLIGFAIARVIGNIDMLIRVIKVDVPIFLYSGLLLCSLFWSPEPLETLKQGVVFVGVTFYAAYLVLRFSLQQILKLLGFMFTISGIVNMVVVVAMPQYGITQVNVSAGITDGGTWDGVFGQKNSLGFVVAVGLPTLIAAARTNHRWRLLFYPAALLQVVLLIGSQSKTMLLATLGPTVLMAVYHLFRSRRTLRGAVILSLVGSTLFTVLFATANIELLARWLDKDVTLTGRVPLWESLIPIALERPFLGHGYAATFGGYFSPVHDALIVNTWNPPHAHNALLQIMLEVGLLGVGLYCFSFLRAVARATKIVAIVPGSCGLWPLVLLTTSLMVSISEAGMGSNSLGWMLQVVASLSVGLHLEHRRSLGLSNDVKAAVRANAARQWIR